MAADELIAPPPALFAGAAILLAELDAVSAGLLEQATSVNSTPTDNIYRARERIIFPSEIKVCEVKTLIQEGKVCKRKEAVLSRDRPKSFTPSVR